MREFLRRLHYLVHRRRLEEELADELEFHLEMAAQKGGTPLGNALRLREEARDAWGWTWIDRCSQDVRYAVRALRQSPGFTASAVLTLAVGVGLNIAAFSFFNLMVLRPLPVRDPGSLLRFFRSSPNTYSDNFPYAAVAFYRERSKTLSGVLALNLSKIKMDGEEKVLTAHFVTGNFFSELGASAGLGRTLDPTRDEAPSAEPVVVLAHGFWQRAFGGDPSLVGTSIRLNGKPATVIGVASREFSGLGLDGPDLWAPMVSQPYFFVGGQPLSSLGEGGITAFMWGRLRPGLAPKAAEAELGSLTEELRRQHPRDIPEKESLPSEPGGYAVRVVPRMYPVLALVGALCLLILAVACGNLGALLLARGVARGREMTIRSAVGAGPGRLVRQLFTESLLLALLGTLVGLALGTAALRSLIAWAALPPWLDPAPDWRVAAFAIGMAFGSAMLFGLTPALQVARLRHRTTTSRQFLIGAQVAASSVLLIVAGLLVRALDRATSAQPGFDYRRVITLDPGLWAHGYTAERARVYLDALEGRLHDLPGVDSVSMATNPPLGNRWSVRRAEVAGRTVAIHVNNVDPTFFRTMTIPVLRGRSLLPGGVGEVVVSESLARLQWPEENPLGKPFAMGVNAAGADVDATVVGVCGSARLVSPEDSDAVEVYQLARGDALPSVTVLVRTAGAPEGVLPSVGSIAKDIDSQLFPEIRLMAASYREKVRASEYAALSASLLGLTALLIACLGIVGLVAYGVSQRTREIGIRMALGAPPSHVLSVVLRQLSRPVAGGLLLGVGGAAALSQVLRGVLYGVSNLDATAYLAAVGIFAFTAAAAALWPARRALRIDPMLALRCD